MNAQDVTDWVAAYGRRHHGIVTWAEARRVGISWEAIRHRAGTGELVRLSHGVFRLRDHPPTWESRLQAALVEAGSGAVVSHRSAARLHRLHAYRLTDAIEVLARRRRKEVIRDGILHQTRVLDTDHVEVVEGFPCTTVARTIFDLCGDPDVKPLKRPGAREVHVSKMLRVANDALRHHGLTVERELAILAVLGKRGRAGTATVRRIFQEMGCRYVPDESELETIFVELIAGADLRAPEKQAHLADEEGWIGRVDFAWRAERVVVEIDSSWHDGPLDQRHDFVRDRRLRALGYAVLRFRWRDLVLQPEAVLRKLRRALARSDLADKTGAMTPISSASSSRGAEVVPFRARRGRRPTSGRRAR